MSKPKYIIRTEDGQWYRAETLTEDDHLMDARGDIEIIDLSYLEILPEWENEDE